MSGDIPSVPVTTLAGLTSISDLLSELPVSDSLSSNTSLNKSLLFHTLVAEESNKLLTVRDDNLVRQLVHAIEQTNSDNIELKSQYALTQLGTNISEYPELLQGIYTFRPTVFNTPQRNQNHQNLINTHVNQQKQIHHSHDQQNQIDLLQKTGSLQKPAQNIRQKTTQSTPLQQQAIVINNVQSINKELQQTQQPIYQQQLTINQPQLLQQQQSSSQLQSHTTNMSSIQPTNTNIEVYQNFESPKSQVNVRHQSNNKQIQQQTNNQHKQQQIQQTQTVINQPILNQQQFFGQQNPGVGQNQPIITVTNQMPVMQPQTLAQSQITPVIVQQCNQQKYPVGGVIQQQHSQQYMQPQNQLLSATSIQTTQHKSPQQQIIIQRPSLPAQQIPLQQIHQQVRHQLPQQQVMQNHQNQQQFSLLSSANPQTQTIMTNDYFDESSKNNLNLMETQSSILFNQISAPNQQLFNTGVQQLTSQQTKPNTVRNENKSLLNKKDKNKTKLKVCITKLNVEDEMLMQQSLTKFVEKSPELAKKIGLIPPAKDNVRNDMFSVMKADEKRTAIKRKSTVNYEEIPPEQILSKPKLRRVEKIIPPTTSKSCKEDVMKSQTYQQFMKNIEHIIEQLDDTEQPNFNSDEIDENIDSISSKMLNAMSNDVAKLKAKGVLDFIPKNKLTLLINYAMRNVYLAKNYAAGPDVDEEIIDFEKILNAIEACLLICNIYSTTKDLKFLQEDNISLIIQFVQVQFRETIFPTYDPVYSVKNIKKSGDNRKKAKSHFSHNRNLQILYSKSVELMKVFVTLFDKCFFVDTIVLPLSTLSIEPFFVDNIETLQFVCLELVTTIFRKEYYVKMRSSILGDILASLDRLPCSKKNLRPFKLANNGGNIQMVTALVLQLIQCATVLPDSISESTNRMNKKSTIKTINIDIVDNNGNGAKSNSEKDLIVLEKYNFAVSIGGNFLTTFLSKCKSRSNETDFRPLFENFIHDLLTTVNKPEWPAAELLLSLLGTLLVKYMSDKNIEQSIRLASLDYLGTVAARLRKDTVESRCKVNIMDHMIKSIKAEQEKEGDVLPTNSNIVLDPDEERIEFLQKILLDFLAVNAQEENLIWDYARHFYLSQWYRDVMQQRKRIAEGQKGYASRKKKTINKRSTKKRCDEESSDSTSEEDESDDDDRIKNVKSRTNDITDQELNLEIFNVLDERKKFLLRKIKPYSDTNTSQHIKTYIDYNNAHLIAQYLASRRPFSQSFDKYLQKIILVVREPAIAIRTRAMKCLANIVEVDPLILKRKDMQMGVNQKFLDTAISVREAAVDLIGKYVLSSEDLIDQYYEMLSKRILDTGVSVRKRVIKILRDICIEYPDFDKIPEICVKMIRRVNDEEGIQKLVTEVFMKMWFTPCVQNDRHGIHRKINQIIDVVNSAHDTGTMWLDGLLNSIFTPKEIMQKNESSENIKKNTEPPDEVVLSCQQLADGLVERLIELEDTDNARMLGCITTIYLLAKVRPQLLVRHAITIEPYLNIKCHPAIAPKFVCLVAEILENVVPLMEHPSDSFLADLEGHLMMLVISSNQTVVASCLSCLGAVVNKITKNYKLIRDCFSKFYKSIYHSRDQLLKNPELPIANIYQPIFRRSLYTIGILMRFFDFKALKVIGIEEGDKIPATICDEVFESLMYFITCSNLEIRKQALVSLGHFCVQNDEYLTRGELKEFYCDLLKTSTVQPPIKIICMRNIWMYLTESELYMHNKEKDWASQAQNDDLKEMNDVSSGMASRIIQLYLAEILGCFLHPDNSVRLWAVKVIQIVLRQGLVHPVRMVPYLIALSTDEKQETAHRSDALLKDIDKTYSGFVNMKIQSGLELSFQLQDILQCKENNQQVVRGYTKRENQGASLNDFLYSLLRNTKPQRRALIQTVTKQFDDQKTTLRQMLYLADNLAYFPYIVQDEPLYLIHQIDLMISVAGTNLLSSFKEGLKPKTETTVTSNEIVALLEDDDDEEDKDVLFIRLPEDTTELQQCIISAQGCMLMLILKQHLKDMYGLTDGKISRYSPSEPQKIYEKAISRKSVKDFQPKSTVDVIQKGNDVNKILNENEKRDLIDKYLDFKQLMLKLDPEDADSVDEENKPKINNSSVGDTPTKNPNTTSGTIQNNDVANTSSNVALTPHVNNLSNSVSSKNEFPSTTPSAKQNKTPSKSVNPRKQQSSRKRAKKKIISDDEDSEDYDEECY